MGDELDQQKWEVLSAYLDGALDDIAAASVERVLRYDPEMRQGLADLRRQKAALKQWAAEVDARPVPPRVRSMLAGARRDLDRGDGPAGENPQKE